MPSRQGSLNQGFPVLTKDSPIAEAFELTRAVERRLPGVDKRTVLLGDSLTGVEVCRSTGASHDTLIRNEKAEGSNPVSSTEHPGQGRSHLFANSSGRASGSLV
jgi:hypothetical protein